MEARFERRLHRLIVCEIRCCYTHGVERLRQHLLVIQIACADFVLIANLAETLRIASRDRGNGCEWMSPINPRILLAHNSKADYSDADFFTHLLNPTFLLGA